jgi:predicted secreted hydrolase
MITLPARRFFRSAIPLLWSLAATGCGSEALEPADPIDVVRALGTTTADGYARAVTAREFEFPEDHGPHPDFRNEWWYFTGNLTGSNGRAFGYQITLFRTAVSPNAVETESAWRTRQIYMGHLAVSDLAAERHYAFERFSRGALELAGAGATPFRVWLEDWQLRGTDDDAFPLRLRAAEDPVSVDLTLTPIHGPILQGNEGLSAKSAEPGNASYYYSYTRLATQGTLSIGGVEYPVTGQSWFDREWSTSALGRDRTGWDWFALHLDDGRDLMFYRLRLADGGMAPESDGVLVAADGRYQRLGAGSVELTPLDVWESPRTGDRYPIRWRMRVPAHDLDLTVSARLPNQEMRLAVRYWEGSVTVTGNHGGLGYLEMTRYTDR